MQPRSISNAETHGEQAFTVAQTLRLYRRHWLVMLVAVAVCGTGGLLWQSRHVEYQTTARLLVTEPAQSPLQALAARFGGVTGDDAFGTQASPMEKYLIYLKSAEFWMTLAKRVLAEPRGGELRRDLLRDRSLRCKVALCEPSDGAIPLHEDAQLVVADSLSEDIAFHDERGNVVVVTARALTPEHSAELANLAADTARQFLVVKDMTQIDGARAYVSGQIDESKKRLQAAQTVLEARLTKSPLSASLYLEELEKRVAALKVNLGTARIERQSHAQLLAAVERQLTSNASAARGGDGAKGDGDARLATALTEQIEALSLRRQELLTLGREPTSADVREIDAEARRVQAQIRALGASPAAVRAAPAETAAGGARARELKSRLASEDARIASLEREVKTAERERGKAPFTGDLVVAEVKSRMDLEYKLLTELSNQLFVLEVQAISLAKHIESIDGARAGRASRTVGRLGTLGASALLALSVCTLLAFAWESYAPTVWSSTALDGLVPIIGAVPRLKGRRQRRRLVLALREIQLRLNTALGQRVRPKGGTVLSLHSAESGAGKTFLSYELATALANSGCRVLLVDGDLYRRVLTARLGRSRPGLAECLLGGAELDDCLAPLSPALTFLGAGGPAAASSVDQLFDQTKLAALVERLRPSYDFVVLDAPPATVATDALTIARASDALLFVVAKGASKVRAVERALGSLEAAGDAARFIVLNCDSYVAGLTSYARYEVQAVRDTARRAS